MQTFPLNKFILLNDDHKVHALIDCLYNYFDWEKKMSKIERAHQKYREGNHEEALQLYSEALEVAKLAAHKIALHSNRAACHLKLQNFKKAAEECSSVLELDGKHAGALMLRAQTLVAMKDYHSALFDVNRLIEVNPSNDVYRKLQTKLKTQLSLAPIPEADEEVVEETETSVSASRNTSTRGSPSEESLNLQSSPSSSQDTHSKGWGAIPKPKGHSGLDYSRWDKVEIDSSDEEEEDDDNEPQFRFRLRTVGVRPVN